MNKQRILLHEDAWVRPASPPVSSKNGRVKVWFLPLCLVTLLGAITWRIPSRWLQSAFQPAKLPQHLQVHNLHTSTQTGQSNRPMVLLNIPNNVSAAVTLTHQIIDNTVGPYDLTIMCAGCQQDASEAVMTRLKNHMDARLEVEYQEFYTASVPRGLQSLSRLSSNAKFSETDALQYLTSLQSVKYALLLDGSVAPADYGWDAQLLRSMQSSSDYLAVSGACTFDVTGTQSSIEPVNIAEQCQNKDYDAVNLFKMARRDFATASMIALDMEKIRHLSLAHLQRLCLGALSSAGWKSSGWLTAQASLSTISLSQAIPDVYEFFRGFQIPDSIFGEEKDKRKDFFISLASAQQIPKTIVTGTSQNHLNLTKKMIRSIRKYDDTRIILYDLGLEEESRKQMAKWPGLELRPFRFDLYPDFFDMKQSVGEYAWKPTLMTDVLREVGGLVLWMDGGNRLWQPLTKIWRTIAKEGAWSTWTEGGMQNWIYPDQWSHFDLPEDQRHGEMCNGAVNGWSATRADMMVAVAESWRACAMMKECIAPVGSSYANHRQDQSALTILLAMSGRQCNETVEGRNFWAVAHLEEEYDPPESCPVTISTHHDNAGEHT